MLTMFEAVSVPETDKESETVSDLLWLVDADLEAVRVGEKSSVGVSVSPVAVRICVAEKLVDVEREKVFVDSAVKVGELEIDIVTEAERVFEPSKVAEKEAESSCVRLRELVLDDVTVADCDNEKDF